MGFSIQNKYRIKSSTGIFHTWSSFITENPNPEITTFLFSLEYLSADATSLQCRCNISSFNANTAVKFKRLWYEGTAVLYSVEVNFITLITPI